ncbi:hypothetical protein OG426_02475 [Streptomyces canus]|uniref:hypothetical protein n=1 Tax=Streptomyces canus TaxID=58343 RepID=UPI0022555857|nr:hypothetical protein [Streptomyces canus]MCX4853349.1 hypothetical protein [Streptomyces canus]WSW31450.1 hypothetical protein OG426_02475 [Streptomyces canus]
MKCGSAPGLRPRPRGGTDGPVRQTLAVVLVGPAGVLWPSGRRPEWLTPQVRTAVPALAPANYH